jgi:hypothetical protein
MRRKEAPFMIVTAMMERESVAWPSLYLQRRRNASSEVWAFDKLRLAQAARLGHTVNKAFALPDSSSKRCR